jgi:ABC-2 type transport system permease protein/lipopolysaccharide transport system permease protein
MADAVRYPCALSSPRDGQCHRPLPEIVMSSFRLAAHFGAGLNAHSLGRAVSDIRDGWHRRALWGTMGLQDIRQRYRRSVIGPFWLTISMGVMVAALGLLYGTIFKQQTDEYLPYVAAGFVIWGLVSSLLLDGTGVFIIAEGLIKQLAAPLSIYVYRAAWSNLIIFFHNVWIFFIVALWYGKSPGWVVLLTIPALAVVVLNGVWMGLLFGMLSARFRDIPQIVASVVQVMFFVTPVIWKPNMLPGRALVLDMNPFYYLVELVRAPLLGYLPSARIWVGVLLITVLGWGVSLLFYAVYRWRLAYWL